MPLTWEHTRRYDSSWPALVLAFQLRYPNPLTPHIVSVDVLSRTVDPTTSAITTERLILKKGAAAALPKWFPTGVLGKTESWVYESSTIDVKNARATVFTRNMDHRTVMDVQEDLVIRPDYDSPAAAVVDTDVVVQSSFGLGWLQSRIETFGLNRFKLATERGRASLHTLVELLHNPFHHQNILKGVPPPLVAMLPPALGESFSRWEGTGEGFQGHGFDDRQKERYVPEHLVPPPPTARTLLQWATEKRLQLSENTSKSMKNIRTKWFGWRLQMREIVKEEQIDNPQQRTNTTSFDIKDSIPAQGEANTQNVPKQTKKTRSWVWEWSRN